MGTFLLAMGAKPHGPLLTEGGQQTLWAAQLIPEKREFICLHLCHIDPPPIEHSLPCCLLFEHDNSRMLMIMNELYHNTVQFVMLIGLS